MLRGVWHMKENQIWRSEHSQMLSGQAMGRLGVWGVIV